MRDEHGRDAGFPLNALDLLARPQAQARVQIGQRLVQKQDARPFDQRPRNGDPLLLSARQLGGLAIQQGFDLHKACRRLRPRVHLLLGELIRALEILKREQDILPDRQVRVQRIVLEYQPHAAFLGRQVRHVILPEEYLPLRRLQQPADHV